MKGLRAETLCLAILGVIGPAALVAGTVRAADEPEVQSSIKELMLAIVDPSADVIWGAVGTVVDKDLGVIETFPRTDEEWLDVRRAAVWILEAGNLLMVPGREAAPPGTRSETPGVELEPEEIGALVKGNRLGFDAFARGLRGLGVEAVRASDAKDTGLLMDVGARMEDVCEGCHQTFWYPREKRP